MRKNLFIFIFFGVLSLFFLRGILLSSGIIIGSDWYLPLTRFQTEIFSEQGLFVWTRSFNLFGERLPHLNTYPFNLFILLLSKIGIDGAVFSKILLVFLLSLIGFSSYYFCRKIGLSFKSSLLSGFIYMTTPLVFNYSIMGWIFYLLMMIILPFFILSFKFSVEQEKAGWSIIAGLLFAIAIFQSQAIFLFPLVLLISFPFLVSSKRKLFVYLKSFFIVGLIAFAFHTSWILPLIFSPEPYLYRTGFQEMGMLARISFINLLRLWGGVWNFQFETVYPKLLLPISFILPILSFLALILKRKNKKVLHLATIALLPLIIYTIRDILYSMPFSIVIRDFGRMMVLSAFPYSVLTAITFEEVGRIKKRILGVLFSMAIVLLLFLNSIPFWTGELYGESKIDHDQRLRVLEFPKEYQEAEEFLLKNHTDTKILFLPSGLYLGFLDNKKFYGPYKEAVDIFAILSPKQGALTFAGKTTGPSVDYGRLILSMVEKKETKELRNLLELTSIDNIVIRKNAYGAGGMGLEIEKTIENLPNVVKVFDNPKISIYKNNSFLPHFYIPQNIVYLNGDIESLYGIMSSGYYGVRPTVYFSGIADNSDKKLITLMERFERKNVQVQNIFQPTLFLKNVTLQVSSLPQTPKIIFVKINPTKYRVIVEGATNPYILVFSEGFHEGWKVYIQTSQIKHQTYGNIIASYFNGEIKEGTHKDIFLDKTTFETWDEKPIPEERHYLVNGYANSWYITPGDSCGKENYEIIIEFWPQRLSYVGLGISILTLISCFGYLIVIYWNTRLKAAKIK